MSETKKDEITDHTVRIAVINFINRSLILNMLLMIIFLLVISVIFMFFFGFASQMFDSIINRN